MKARINRQKILLYHLGAESEKGSRIRKLLDEQRISAVELDEAALGQTLGYLAGIPGYTKAEAVVPEPAPDQELMAFCGFSDSSLNDFLQAYRRAQIAPVALKAVVTPHNREWRLIDLFGELKREHAFFQKYQELQLLARQAAAHQVSASKEEAVQIEALLERVETFRLEDEPDPAELDSLVSAFREAAAGFSPQSQAYGGGDAADNGVECQD